SRAPTRPAGKSHFSPGLGESATNQARSMDFSERRALRPDRTAVPREENMKRSIARGMLAALAVSLLSSGTVWSPRKEALVNSVRAAEGCSLKTLHGS